MSRMTVLRLLIGLLCLPVVPLAVAAEAKEVHGLWVWKGPTLLAQPGASEALREFCTAQDINEVYLSVMTTGQLADATALAALVDLLHHAHVRVEALLSSTDADQPGRHRDMLLAHVRAVLAYNSAHPEQRFDGIHLDIEPQQRPENKGPGNLRFLPDLTESWRAVRALAAPAGLTVNADIQNKLLKGSLEERRLLLSTLPRLTLMLYELSKPGDGSVEQQTDKLRDASRSFLAMAYAGLDDSRGLAALVIALRTPDYGALLPRMLDSLDTNNIGNSHYAGWARHSYSDVWEAGR
jgi:hypothetical protein